LAALDQPRILEDLDGRGLPPAGSAPEWGCGSIDPRGLGQPRRPRVIAPEQLDAILAGLLGAVQRAVGAAHQILAVARLALGIRRDAERRGDPQRLRRLAVGRD